MLERYFRATQERYAGQVDEHLVEVASVVGRFHSALEAEGRIGVAGACATALEGVSGGQPGRGLGVPEIELANAEVGVEGALDLMKNIRNRRRCRYGHCLSPIQCALCLSRCVREAISKAELVLL